MAAMSGRSGSMRKPHVLLVEARLPAYRVPAWSALREELTNRGVTFDLAVGAAHPADRVRNDERDIPWAVHCPTRFISLGSMRLRDIRSAPLIKSMKISHVILEQALTDMGTYRTWVTARRQNVRVALLGHGRNYNYPATSPRNQIKAHLTRRADWFFSYTDGGASQVRERDYPADRITVVTNSTRTPSGPETQNLSELSRTLGLESGPKALFLGSLEPRKGLDELCEAAVLTARLHPRFTVLIGGDGSLAQPLAEKRESGCPIVLLGRLDDREKALALSVADFVVVPRQLGLVVVDALAAGRPVVTLRGDWHGPESEYLTDKVDSLWVDPGTTSLANAMRRLIEDPTYSLRCKPMLFEHTAA